MLTFSCDPMKAQADGLAGKESCFMNAKLIFLHFTMQTYYT